MIGVTPGEATALGHDDRSRLGESANKWHGVESFCVTRCLLQAVPPRYHSGHEVRRPINRLGDTNVADDDKRWQDMNPDEQAVVIRQINGAVNGLQFRIQDIEDAVKALQERLKR